MKIYSVTVRYDRQIFKSCFLTLCMLGICDTIDMYSNSIYVILRNLIYFLPLSTPRSGLAIVGLDADKKLSLQPLDRYLSVYPPELAHPHRPHL